MRILVTGCSGFIGYHLCKRLLAKGDTVIGIDNLASDANQKLKACILQKLRAHDKFEFHKADISEGAAAKAIIDSRPECLVHLAAKSEVRVEDPKGYSKDNVFGLLNVLEAVSKSGVRNFIFASTSSVYGDRKDNFSESSPTDNQTSLYGATKKFGELACMLYGNSRGIDGAILRLFTVYGPMGRLDMAIPKFIANIDGGKEIELFAQGDIKKDFIYIDDVIDAIELCIAKTNRFEIFNIGSGNACDIKYIVSIIESELGKDAKIRLVPNPSGNATFSKADISKAKIKLGWAPKISIEEGLARTVEWWKKEGKLLINTVARNPRALA